MTHTYWSDSVRKLNSHQERLKHHLVHALANGNAEKAVYGAFSPARTGEVVVALPPDWVVGLGDDEILQVLHDLTKHSGRLQHGENDRYYADSDTTYLYLPVSVLQHYQQEHPKLPSPASLHAAGMKVYCHRALMQGSREGAATESRFGDYNAEAGTVTLCPTARTEDRAQAIADELRALTGSQTIEITRHPRRRYDPLIDMSDKQEFHIAIPVGAMEAYQQAHKASVALPVRAVEQGAAK